MKQARELFSSCSHLLLLLLLCLLFLLLCCLGLLSAACEYEQDLLLLRPALRLLRLLVGQLLTGQEADR
jgi:hypothetical protein